MRSFYYATRPPSQHPISSPLLSLPTEPTQAMVHIPSPSFNNIAINCALTSAITAQLPLPFLFSSSHQSRAKSQLPVMIVQASWPGPSLAFSLFSQPRSTPHTHYHHSASHCGPLPAPKPTPSFTAAITKFYTRVRSPSSGHLCGFRWTLQFLHGHMSDDGTAQFVLKWINFL